MKEEVLPGRQLIAELTNGNGLVRNVLEDMEDKVSQNLLRMVADNRDFAPRNRQDVVIFLAVFELFHEPERLALYDLSGGQNLPGQDKTIHIESIVSGGSQNESVRERVGARNARGAKQLQRLFVMKMLDKAARFVLDKYSHDSAGSRGKCALYD